MEDIQKISSSGRRKIKAETVLTNSSSDNKGNLTLYLGASAFFISIVSAVLLYREIIKMKKSLGDVKQLKNQLTNMDSRFEDMDEQLKKVLNIVSKQQKSIIPQQILMKPSFQQQVPLNQPQMPIPQQKNNIPIPDSVEVQSVSSEDIEGESESDNDSEISYESDSVEG